MPVQFWIWLFFAIITLWGGALAWTSTAGKPSWAWGHPLIMWLWMLCVTYAIAPQGPFAALVHR